MTKNAMTAYFKKMGRKGNKKMQRKHASDLSEWGKRGARNRWKNKQEKTTARPTKSAP